MKKCYAVVKRIAMCESERTGIHAYLLKHKYSVWRYVTAPASLQLKNVVASHHEAEKQPSNSLKSVIWLIWLNLYTLSKKKKNLQIIGKLKHISIS